MNLDVYRERAAAYLAERAEDFYRYASGRKASLDLGSLYRKYGDELFSDERVRELDDLRSRRDGLEARSVGNLLGFAVEQNLDMKVRALDEQIASEATVAGINTLTKRLANTAERSERQELYGELRSGMARLHRLQRERLELYSGGCNELLGRTLSEFFVEVTGLELGLLRSQLQRFLRASGDYYFKQLDRFTRLELGLEAGEVEAWDVPFLLRGVRYDRHFEEGRSMSMAKRTLMGMGFDLKKISNIVIDGSERAGKSAGSHCIRVSVPGKIYLCLRPQGGLADVLNLFHEVGRALQSAHVDESQPFEFRMLGDGAVCRTMGFLFQYLTLNPEWLADYLRLSGGEELREFIRFRKLYELRGAAERFLAVGEFLDAGGSCDDEAIDGLAEVTNEVLGLPHDSEFVLAGLERPLSSTDFLRGWIFEAELREILSGRFGERWYSRPAAGDFLRELWSYGQRFTAEELASRIRLVELNMGPITRELG